MAMRQLPPNEDAVMAGSTVSIRQGKDLLVFTLLGSEDEPATSRKVLDITKARM